MGKFIKDARRWFGDRSLPAASLMSGAGLLLVAGVVLWLTGRPQGGPWYDWHVEPMLWKDRLTYAAAVAAGIGAGETQRSTAGAAEPCHSGAVRADFQAP